MSVSGFGPNSELSSVRISQIEMEATPPPPPSPTPMSRDPAESPTGQRARGTEGASEDREILEVPAPKYEDVREFYEVDGRQRPASERDAGAIADDDFVASESSDVDDDDEPPSRSCR